jgi:hypothetical protein
MSEYNKKNTFDDTRNKPDETRNKPDDTRNKPDETRNKPDETRNKREIFIESIQKWVKLDTQIKLINDKVKQARSKKNELLDEITNYVNENNIENTKIEISDGELRFFKKKEYQPITFKYVEESLGKIISDSKQVEYIMNYLRDNRVTSVSTDIRRVYNSYANQKEK